MNSPTTEVYKRYLRKLRPDRLYDDEPKGMWDELVDVADFLIGSALVIALRTKPAEESSEQQRLFRTFAVSTRVGATVVVAAVVALPLCAPEIWPKLGVGNTFVYALTLFVGGLVTLIPGRLAELRRREPPVVTGTDYPKTLRKALLFVESIFALLGFAAIVIWGFGGPEDHPYVRAVVWGIFAISLSEFFVFSYAVLLAYADEVGATLAAEESAAEQAVSGTSSSAVEVGKR
jgi:hypothetical protein